MNIEVKKKDNINYFSFFATGTNWIVKVDPIGPNLFDSLKNKIEQTVVPFEEQYSRFKDTSLLSQLRNTGELKNPPEDLLTMIDLGIKLNKISEGHFNLAIGNVLESKGYDKDYSFKETKETNKNEDWLLEKNDSILKIKKGTQLDFGSFGKGFLADILHNALLNDYGEVLINAGGDIRYTNKSKIQKKFVLENPFDPSQYIGTIELESGAIASSSTNRRMWKDQSTGKIFTHLSSFKSEEELSGEKILALYTQAETCIIADAAATTLFISPSHLHAKIETELNVNFLIVLENGKFFKSKNYSGILNS
ncbi:FAD:protein FMN transferase [Candidatus Dojkabacteria bacterium]|uniref:FAD:protein FMN transferase n=1 Tax=Candidatus Dojkabacteria bacterium TaxID=2099670 RepID=A0A955RGV5_9BACT|nr:FAD:protein FMN transferase [Candidatus Dojkabacteria bacterium]